MLSTGSAGAITPSTLHSGLAVAHPPRDPGPASALADLDPELLRLPLGVPAAVLGERRLGNTDRRGILLIGAVTNNTRVGRG
jgi:hypothetical protein